MSDDDNEVGIEETSTEESSTSEENFDLNDMTPIDTSEENENMSDDDNEVGIDESVILEDGDADIADEENVDVGGEDEEEFTIGNDAGVNDDGDLDSMTPIDTGDVNTAPAEEEHLDDLDEIHKDIEEAAADDKEATALMQESIIRKRVAYIPALQKLAVTLFKEDLAHTKKSKEGYLLGESNVLTQMEKMFAEAAEKINTGARTNPLTVEEYKAILKKKANDFAMVYESKADELARYKRLYNGDENKAIEALNKSQRDVFKALILILYDMLVLFVIGMALGLITSMFIGSLPHATTIGILLGYATPVGVNMAMYLHMASQISIYMDGESKAKGKFDYVMNSIRNNKEISDVEKAKVETYAKAEYERYLNATSSTKLSKTDVSAGFTTRLMNSIKEYLDRKN